MRKREEEKAGKRNFQLVRGREAFIRRKQVLASPLGGLQIIAGHLNELTGLRSQFVESDRPSFVKDEVEAWELAERIVSQPLAQAVDLYNGEARKLPMLVQVELVQGETSTFLASQEKHGDRRGDVLRHLWWYYFPKNDWRRLKNCPVCRNWFVDTSKNRVTARCSSECTAHWWSRDRRKAAGHRMKGAKPHAVRRTRVPVPPSRVDRPALPVPLTSIELKKLIAEEAHRDEVYMQGLRAARTKPLAEHKKQMTREHNKGAKPHGTKTHR